MLRVLAIAEFDPAGVLAGHRRALGALGVDYRVACHDVYLDRQWDRPNWHEGDLTPTSAFALRTFAAQADIIQFHPAIGQPWSYESTVPRFWGDSDDRPFAGCDWREFKRPRRVAYFHGSRNAAANMAAYTHHYRGRGFVLAASTLDYVQGLGEGTLYLPPVVDLQSHPRAPLRRNGEPLRLIQCPTDPGFCHTDLLRRVVARIPGVDLQVLTEKPHAEVLRAKGAAHAGFDHLRGAFSVNTWENAALGLVPLVRLRDDARKWLEPHGFTVPPWPVIGESVLEDVIRELAGSAELTRLHQDAARRWATTSPWSHTAIAAYLKRQYEEIARR